MGLAGSSSLVRTPALDEVLAHVGSLDASALGALPGTAAMVLDRDLVVRLMQGPAWESYALDLTEGEPPGHAVRTTARHACWPSRTPGRR